MAPNLRLPTLLLTTLSITLCTAIIACAAHTLQIFHRESQYSTYFLPAPFTTHLDTRELPALIGTSATILLLNLLFAAALLIQALPATNALTLLTTLLSTTLSLPGIILPATLNARAPTRDTLLTWTCRFRSIQNEGVPSEFDGICHETRFAFYTTIPVFLIQVVLLGLAVYTAFLAKPGGKNGAEVRRHRRESRKLAEEDEKDVELGRMRKGEGEGFGR